MDIFAEAVLNPTKEADKAYLLFAYRDMKHYIRIMENKTNSILFEERLTLNRKLYEWIGKSKWQVCYDLMEWQSRVYTKHFSEIPIMKVAV